LLLLWVHVWVVVVVAVVSAGEGFVRGERVCREFNPINAHVNTYIQGPPHLALEHRPTLWNDVLRALGRRKQEQQQQGQQGGRDNWSRSDDGRSSNGYLDAAALPEEGLEKIEPMAFE